jgi:hypothetical protein
MTGYLPSGLSRAVTRRLWQVLDDNDLINCAITEANPTQCEPLRAAPRRADVA